MTPHYTLPASLPACLLCLPFSTASVRASQNRPGRQTSVAGLKHTEKLKTFHHSTTANSPTASQLETQSAANDNRSNDIDIDRNISGQGKKKKKTTKEKKKRKKKTTHGDGGQKGRRTAAEGKKNHHTSSDRAQQEQKKQQA